MLGIKRELSEEDISVHGSARSNLSTACLFRARRLMPILYYVHFKICFTQHDLNCGVNTSRGIQKFSFLCEDEVFLMSRSYCNNCVCRKYLYNWEHRFTISFKVKRDVRFFITRLSASL